MRISLIILLLFISLFSSAQLKEYYKKYNKQDTSYIKPLKHRFMVSPAISLRTGSIAIKSKEANAENVVYRPNIPARIGLGGVLEGVYLGFSLKMPSYINNKGNTEVTSWYFSTQTKFLNWGLDFYWLGNRGLYFANNKKLFVEGAQKNLKYFRPDISTLDVGLSTHMIFSEKFSLKAALQLSEKQIKSAGGFAVKIDMNYSNFRSDSSIVPYFQREYYDDISEFIRGNYYNIRLRPGYGYTFVKKDFYVSSLIYAGIGFQMYNHSSLEKRKYGLGIVPSYRAEFAVGYDREDVFIKLSSYYDNTRTKVKNFVFLRNQLMFSVTAGFRFGGDRKLFTEMIKNKVSTKL